MAMKLPARPATSPCSRTLPVPGSRYAYAFDGVATNRQTRTQSDNGIELIFTDVFIVALPPL